MKKGQITSIAMNGNIKMSKQLDVKSLFKKYIPDFILNDEVQPTEQCPNCGKWVKMGDCRFTYHGKTGWGGYTLYGVCKDCYNLHMRLEKINKNK